MKLITRYRIDKERTKWGYFITWYAHWISTNIIEGEMIDDIVPYENKW